MSEGSNSNGQSHHEPAGAPGLIVASQVYPERLPIIGLGERPLFPKTVFPLVIDSPATGQVVKEVVESKTRLVGAILRRPLEGEVPTQPEEVFHRVGVIAQILKAEVDDKGVPRVLLGAMDRFEVQSFAAIAPYPVAEVSYLYEAPIQVTDELKAYALAVINTVKDLVKLNPLFKEELNLLVTQGAVGEPARLADYAAYLTSAGGEELQGILETLDVRERLEKVVTLLKKELDISKLQAEIRERIDERISKQQREFFLREQLKAIKKELGLEKDDKEAELARFVERLESRQPSEEARGRIDEELDKLRMLEPSSPEYTVTRNYLEWLTTLPWGTRSDATVTMPRARQILDEDHYGLDDVKSRILELIAAGMLKGTFGGSIMCLVGPPGVGKTSIGKSIARALGREFYRFSLGGMRDEAEIKGHRRTYIGAMPGKFLQALRTCRTDDPVIMLDEIDKIGSSYRGDPASALLEALDPEQNREFLDHYLDVRYDLSNVLFVCTANQLDTIPGPLLDRMDLVKLSGYILEEKLEIAQRYLIPRQRAALNLKQDRVRVTKTALRGLIDGYAREAGVRSLEQQIRRLFRKSAVKLVEGAKSVKIGPEEVRAMLGRPRFESDASRRKLPPGVVMGLAWTSMGGDTLFIEATATKGRSGLKQTGQLGKVMIESSEIAYTYVRSLCDADPRICEFFANHLIHIHVPAGATPKDGPSAGITMASALYTLAAGKPIKAGFAMTGELNLSGQVMPVGGIKEKVIAARRAGVKDVILPEANRADHEQLPAHVTKGLRVHFASEFTEVVRLCLP
jgi:ATP-dependent Lon protease